jgi:hypothetical protein
MALCRGLPQSHPLQTVSPAPKAELERSFPHSPPHNSQHHTSLVHLFFRLTNSVWCIPRLRSSLLLCLLSLGLPTRRVFPPRVPLALVMPRIRGKSKRGAAWYEARGRKPHIPDSPPEADLPPPEANSPWKVEFPPALAPIVVPTPAQPLFEHTLDLSPLSNPYACRIEWFDHLDNSMGFSPPPPSPPR